MMRLIRVTFVMVLGTILLNPVADTRSAASSVLAADTRVPDAAKVEQARTTVKMLDDLYKTAVVAVTNKYVEQQSDTPAAAVAKEVFEAMHKKGWHTARLVDATGKPKNKDNVARTEFEKKAVEAIKGGKPYIEELGEDGGMPVFRAATVVPSVLKQCAICHGGKEGRVLGVIAYEVPIR